MRAFYVNRGQRQLVSSAYKTGTCVLRKPVLDGCGKNMVSKIYHIRRMKLIKLTDHYSSINRAVNDQLRIRIKNNVPMPINWTVKS